MKIITLLSISSIDARRRMKRISQRRWFGLDRRSTGEFFVKCSTYDGLRDELARVGPKEIILDKRLELDSSHPIHMTLIEEGYFVSYITPSARSFQTIRLAKILIQ